VYKPRARLKKPVRTGFCCSVVDGEFQLKLVPATKKGKQTKKM